jgi:fructokinase
MKHKVIAFGEIVWDMLPSGRQLGGAPLNFCYFADVAGAEAYVISAVGSERLGDETIGVVSHTGVSVSYIQRSQLPTGYVNVQLDAHGHPEYEIVEDVAWDAIGCPPEALQLVQDASVFCWGSLAQRSESSRASLYELLESLPKSCLKVFDINIRQHYYSVETIEKSLRCADVLKLNEDELPLIADLFGINGAESEIVRSLIDTYSLKFLIYTHGADFSEVYSSEGEYSHIDTPKVEVKDTVGAGDSFTAIFVVSLLLGHSLADSHRAAVDVSAEVCTKNGAIDVVA